MAEFIKPTLRFVTIYPQLVSHYLDFAVMAQAQKKSLVHFETHDLRASSTLPHRAVDAPPYGGGEGMVMRADVLACAVKRYPDDYIITTSPAGRYFDQHEAQRLYELFISGRSITFVCGRFSGLDERFIKKYVDDSYSLGDFVVSGGELPSLMIAESIVRLLPGVLGNHVSVQQDSFGVALKNQLHAPLYTRPEMFEDMPVPQVLRSGDHAAIKQWKEQASQRRSAQKFRR
ncbi:MAG: tRNA (guanosine(37)-N1)-methyltransferase TrmD [Proteobacteria bacterium]|nr:tRNA (guanosine(37)-N1)-methyltransferase TrmD [Pseudomonadota bacterium]